MKNKPYYKSATIWLNFIILAISLFDRELFSIFGMSDENISKVMIVLMRVVALLNIIIRTWLTKSKISSK